MGTIPEVTRREEVGVRDFIKYQKIWSVESMSLLLIYGGYGCCSPFSKPLLQKESYFMTFDNTHRHPRCTYGLASKTFGCFHTQSDAIFPQGNHNTVPTWDTELVRIFGFSSLVYTKIRVRSLLTLTVVGKYLPTLWVNPQSEWIRLSWNALNSLNDYFSYLLTFPQ